MKKKYFVTGGSGFIGSAIVRSLVEQGHEVIVLDNNSRGSIDKLGKVILDNITFIEGDIRSPESLSQLKGCDSIIHLAYINGTRFFYEIPYDILDIGIRGMINILDAVKKYSIPQLILASSSEVYQFASIIPTPENIPLIVPDINNPRYSYGGGKIASELLAINFAKQFNLDVRIFRPHNVYGPDMGFEHVIPEICKKIFDAKINKLKKIKMQGSGDDTRAFIFIDDFVNGINKIIIAGAKNEIYHIGSSHEVTIKLLYDKLISISGDNFTIETESSPIGSTPKRCPDITKIKELGFETKILLEEGLRITYNWYMNYFEQMGLK